MASIIKVDSLQEKTSGNGIVLENSLKDSTGVNEVISPSGSITIPSGQSIKNSSGTSLIDATGTMSSDMVFPAGHVVQVVNNVGEIATSTTSSTFTASGGKLSITPSNASSKILGFFQLAQGNTATSGRQLNTAIFRNGTNLSNINNGWHSTLYSSSSHILSPIFMHWLDTPNMTSSIEYEIYYRSGTSGGIVYIQEIYTITLMEITA